MRADASDLLGEHARGSANGAAAEHDRARPEGAEAERPDRGVAVADRNQRGIDAELVRGDLRERRLVALAVVLHADIDDHRAVRQHADIGGLVARHHARLALDPFDDAVAALLGVERKADADGAAVGLALRLALADGRQIDHVARGVERGDIVAGVEPHAGGGLVRQLGRGDDVLPAQIERLAAKLARHLVDQPLDGEAGAGPRHAAIGAHRRLVGGDRVGLELQMPDAIRARSGCATPCSLP